MNGIRILEVNAQVISLAKEYSQQLPLPANAAFDAVHIACATLYEMDYLVTWNCKHIANAHVIRRLTRINDAVKRFTPLIVTPEALME